MKAVIHPKYGTVEVLRIEEVPTPTPKENEVLVKIAASTIGPVDCFNRAGNPFAIRLVGGLFKPKHPIPGTTYTGTVVSVGKSVTRFKKGDEVFGSSSIAMGTHAEYRCSAEDSVITHKPHNMTFDEAAGLCDGATTALWFFRDTVQVKPNQKVLIIGASGGVGCYSVQLAKYYGAHVTGVCSGRNAELVTSLGADNVIDYQTTDFTLGEEKYDIIFDAVGKSSYGKCRRVLNPKGNYLVTDISFSIFWNMFWTKVWGGKRARVAFSGLNLSQKGLIALRELIEQGHMRSIIDKRYRFEEIREAHQYVDLGHKRGNVVLTIAS